ncbi:MULTISPECIES: hypothetical protein [unclassified Tolypothrix]|uniref:hypothetical protein n=1 Tax=unclassified Tolypothrix TaxID=2649714 RepID=UPI000A784F0D|nr:MULTISPECIES: hypothetical protein [unclassified Tolypothrix]MBE9084904.1 hypothetical protein [Tolypothrix sp. LEGE 11397]UYD33552.1 hypothetical protein HG267_32320 [Tolypothrix sp. PCC 7601]
MGNSGPPLGIKNWRAILELLSLERATGNENILLNAIACGQHFTNYPMPNAPSMQES